MKVVLPPCSVLNNGFKQLDQDFRPLEGYEFSVNKLASKHFLKI